MKRNEHGQLLVLEVLVLGFIVMPMFGLVIQLGFVYAARQQAQNSADAAALAGASLLPDSNRAIDEATKYAVLNGADHITVNIGPVTTGPPHTVNVVAYRKTLVLVRFLPVSAYMNASATATRDDGGHVRLIE